MLGGTLLYQTQPIRKYFEDRMVKMLATFLMLAGTLGILFVVHFLVTAGACLIIMRGYLHGGT